MSTPSWLGAGGSSQPAVPGDPSLDRQMIRHLVNRYSSDELARLFQEIRNGPASDGASIISSTQSSVISDDQSSIWDAGSVRSFSDTTSITGSIISNVSRGTAKLLSRRNQSSSSSAAAAARAQAQQQAAAQAQQEAQGWEAAAAENGAANDSGAAAETASIASGSAKQKGTFMCGFCGEEDIVKTCTRKNDLKRHIEDFHNVDAQWFCRHRGCQMVFDWQGAYKTHLKQAHGGSRMSLDEAKVNLCPQVVFACGFENCAQIFESLSDAEAPATFKDYVAHVVKHFDEGSNSGEWSYSARIRNLLRQSAVQAAWAESGFADPARQQHLQWSTQTSGVLRKRLESRHVGDPKALVQFAYFLGSSDPNAAAVARKLRDEFTTPVADTCAMEIPGHRTRQPAMAAAAPPAGGDPFQFRISRNANPALAAYLASQRKVYAPPRQRTVRPPQLHQVRASLPAATSAPMASADSMLAAHGHTSHHHQQQHNHHHHQHHHGGSMHGSSHHHAAQRPSSHANPTQGHFFASMPDVSSPSAMHDPHGAGSGPQPFSATNSILHHNGIIADDMQSLRSLAGGTPEPLDVDMQDGLLPDFSHYAATPGNLGSPAMSEHGGSFYHEGNTPHAF